MGHGIGMSFIDLDEKIIKFRLLEIKGRRIQFQAKLFQLDAQIDTIARNERLIDMMEDRQATIDEHSRFQANSLDQLNNRLTQIRTEQRARIETITNKDAVYDIETRAKWEIDRNAQPHQVQPSEPLLIEPTVIEITPEDAQPSEPLASNS